MRRLPRETESDDCQRLQDGLCPLVHAAFRGHTEVVSLLLSYGARVDVVATGKQVRKQSGAH